MTSEFCADERIVADDYGSQTRAPAAMVTLLPIVGRSTELLT